MDTQQQKPFKVLLVGDRCVDVYQYGEVKRISPEAPVPIFKITKTERKPGMGANVAENLRALGCQVFEYYGEHSTKTRIIDTKSKQHLIRIDDDVVADAITFGMIKERNFDAIVVSDYCKGSITYDLVHNLRYHYPDTPIFVDSKKMFLDKFKGCFVKINESEFLSAKTNTSEVIVTLGDRGAQYKGVVYQAPHIEVTDVTGAGDTFLAALTFEYLRTNKIQKSIPFAIKASTITVQHFGCYAPTLEEICG